MSKKSDKRQKQLVRQKIVKLLKSKPNSSYSNKQIAKKLGFTQPIKKKLASKILRDLVHDKVVLEKPGETYQFNPSIISKYQGEISFTQSGSAYILSGDERKDIFVDRRNTRNALDGDLVSYAVVKKSSSGKIEGKVVEVIERKQTQFVGTIDVSAKFAFVIPSNKKIHVDFFIDLKKIGEAKTGQKVLVELTDWPLSADSPYGKVVKVLGEAGETSTEIHAILEEFGLPYEFPQEVLEASNEISTEITQEEIKKRRDFRSIPTFTIDPYDAKDFDDALSFQRLENGNIEVGVHIADVSHYVTPNSIIDKEAVERSTSVYLVDRVVPMLPEVLSNQVCSLRPDEEKYCFSAVFELDHRARVHNQWFGRTVIKSIRRFTYEEAQERIETKDGDYQEEINILDSLAKILRENRLKQGALDVFSKEVKFKVNEDGKPDGVMIKTSKDAHKLIEEFMLLANRSVASLLGKKKEGEIQYPNIYRVHDEPSEQKIADLKLFLDEAGYQLHLVKGKPISYALNKVLKEAEEKDEIEFVAPMVIRSMAKAEYSPDNIGHYGLAFDYYSHFTSPIRRYPDLETHRILQNYLDKASPKRTEEELDKACKHYSNREKLATEAERASIKFMQVLYMSDKVGQTFKGKITGIAKYGIFVEDSYSKSEGLIRIRSIKQDHFFYEEDTNQFVGKNTGDVLRMGTPVEIKLIKTDLINKNIDFELVRFGDDL